MSATQPLCSTQREACMATRDYAHRRTGDHHRIQLKMATEEAQQIYARRSQIAEFPHAWIKQRCGLRQFRCRGRLKVTMEATWACLSYNLARWFSLRRKFTMELSPA